MYDKHSEGENINFPYVESSSIQTDRVQENNLLLQTPLYTFSYWLDTNNKEFIGLSVPRATVVSSIIGLSSLIIALAAQMASGFGILVANSRFLEVPNLSVLGLLGIITFIVGWTYGFKYIGYYKLNRNGKPLRFISRYKPDPITKSVALKRKAFLEKVNLDLFDSPTKWPDK